MCWQQAELAHDEEEARRRLNECEHQCNHLDVLALAPRKAEHCSLVLHKVKNLGKLQTRQAIAWLGTSTGLFAWRHA